MGVEHHTHTGGNAGPKLNTNECLVDGAFNQSIGKSMLDDARAGRSYAGYCLAYDDPPTAWVNPFQILAKLQGFTARAGECYAGACFATAN